MLSLFNRWLALRPASLNRTLYTRPAKFIELSPRGSLIESKVDITMGDPHEAFILLPKDVGHAFRGAISRDGSLLVRDEDVCPSIFHHETRHFANNLPLILNSKYLKISLVNPIQPRALLHFISFPLLIQSH
ncbi:hypothetical protein CIHG_00351 [Coccidioides immitis H538.4]|uniref:Uncharacterized protein n=1 Tax=Coccidioides immitis H538.4 TaxID=396776 RepID=A0A0J8RBI0_COCIT|nr:hypothetical protein CIHG_00351 [Coccidioides immitis H538.4]